MTLNGDALWYCTPKVGQNRAGAEGFLKTSDGVWLMGVGRQNGLFSCLETENGNERWSYSLDATCADVVSADAEGDGEPEFLVATSHGTLVAIGDNKTSPRILWKTEVSVSLGTPFPVDLDADGTIEIVCVSSDGYINVFDASSHPK